MFVKEIPTETLADIREGLAESTVDSIDVSLGEVEFDLINNNVIKLDKLEIQSTIPGLVAFGEWVNIPGKFLQRCDRDIQQWLLTNMLGRIGGTVRVFYNEYGVKEVHDPRTEFIPPHKLVDIAAKVIDPKALVAEFWQTKDEFRLDVIVPEGFDRGIGGDKKAGDITRGGIRIGQDRKHNLSPWVSEYLYRLQCTNGIEVYDEGLKVDARGKTVPEVLVYFEAMADRAFRRVEKSIESFYGMRGKRVANPERDLMRIADEEGISTRILDYFLSAAPALDDPSEFDLVNLITNLANDSKVKAGPSRKLQRIGGNLVTQHTERCNQCRAKLIGHEGS